MGKGRIGGNTRWEAAAVIGAGSEGDLMGMRGRE